MVKITLRAGLQMIENLGITALNLDTFIMATLSENSNEFKILTSPNLDFLR